MEVFQVGDTFDSKRLDIVMTSHKKVSSRSEAQRIIKSGSVTVNQSSDKINPNRKVYKGDVVEFSVPHPAPSGLIPVSKTLDIVYEDELVIVLNKPAGMVVHPSAGHRNDTLVNYLLHHTRLPENDPVRPGIVHRIDKDTSGLLVVAKDLKSHEHLAKQFFRHTIERKYEAIVWGLSVQPVGRIDKPIGRHATDRKKFAVRSGGKSAVTHWKVLEQFKYLSLIECKLETGRTHQIRVHMNSIGHPLLGDLVYGRYRNYAKKLSDQTIKLLKQYDGQALHAKSLGFVHPGNKEWMVFERSRPENMQLVIDALKNEIDNN